MNEEQKPGFFKRAATNVKDSIAERTKQMEVATSNMMQQSLLRQILPLVKKAIPGIEAKLKNYLSGTDNEDFKGDGINKLIIMRHRANGRVEIKIVNADLVALEVKAESEAEAAKAVIKSISLDEYVQGFIKGEFDTNTEDIM